MTLLVCGVDGTGPLISDGPGGAVTARSALDRGGRHACDSSRTDATQRHIVSERQNAYEYALTGGRQGLRVPALREETWPW